jgi:hypothetical protein
MDLAFQNNPNIYTFAVNVEKYCANAFLTTKILISDKFKDEIE